MDIDYKRIKESISINGSSVADALALFNCVNCKNSIH